MIIRDKYILMEGIASCLYINMEVFSIVTETVITCLVKMFKLTK